MKEILIDYTKYNVWANKSMINLFSASSEDDVDRNLGGSFHSIRKTIYHIWGAESIWLQRLQLKESILVPQESFVGSFQQACLEWANVSNAFVNYCQEVNHENALMVEFSYRNLQGQLFSSKPWECIHHCMNHSTFHRGQLVQFARMLGMDTIPSTDFITYTRQK
jgi:uncharacterized damage-inducible protein DinB